MSRRKAGAARTVDYATLADLRYQIRRFLRVRETGVRAAGIEPQQYLLLLQVKGLDGRRAATIGALAERLQIRHHSTVQLVDRLEARRLVVRRPHGDDRRVVLVEITAGGEALLRRLALTSLAELQTAGPVLMGVLARLTNGGPRKSSSSPRRRGGSR
ncbi:MAG: MarR family transcriptional regulator [Candidatus Rokubacteria bacterium]|nr:MarR family transcriptional regulator [Candidatus Rokubacteria bacterium]